MESIYQAILMIGPQGSGKGTQCVLLAKELGYYHFSSGAELRSLDPAKSELNREVLRQVDQGILLSDELLLGVFGQRIKELAQSKGLIMDGTPRRVKQAEFVVQALHESGKNKIATVHLDIPKEESIARLLKRAEKEGREDDTLESIELRLAQYYSDTLPMVDYLKAVTDYLLIDGSGTIEAVHQQIINKIISH